MIRHIQLLQFLLTLLAGWINRRQLDAIDYLKEENRLLKERLGGRCGPQELDLGLGLASFCSYGMIPAC